MTALVDHRVPGMPWSAIEQIAENWRTDLGCADQARLPIAEIFDFLNGMPNFFDLHIETTSFMGDAEGLTCPHGTFIYIREDVYDAACKGHGRARFTLAHEFGHWVLRSKLPMQRVINRAQIKPYQSAERQADVFATRLLMPTRFLRLHDNVDDVMDRFGVTKSAATFRLSDFREGR